MLWPHPLACADMQMYTTPRHLVMIHEHVKGGSLGDLLERCGPFSEVEAWYAFRQIVDALTHCHEKVSVQMLTCTCFVCLLVA